jgi:hypothetical protein
MELAATHLPPTGERLLIPPLGENGARLVLEGIFTFRYTGMRFDALHRSGADGDFAQRHSYLQWRPCQPLLEAADVSRHRYQFLVPAGWRLQGQSLGLRVDVDRFVDEFLIPPSEVREALTGEMSVRVLSLTPAPMSMRLLAAAWLPASLVAGGLGWVIHRRRLLQGLPPELQQQLDRINRRYHIARAALRSTPNARLEESLRAVHAGAWTLAGQIRALHEVRSRIDYHALKTQADRLEREVAGFSDPVARTAGQVAVGEKRKALVLLEEMERVETRLTLRLDNLEASLDTALLTLRRPPADASASFDALLRSLDADVSAVAEVARVIEALEALPRGGEV